MTEKELSIKLRESARGVGLCDEWYNGWKDETALEELVGKYLRGLDFCIKHRWPTKSFIKKNFTQGFLRRHGILVDDTRSYPIRDENRRQMYLREYVLLGKSHATVRYAFRPHMCQVWVCDNSDVTVDVKYGAFVLVHLFDNSRADVKTDLVSSATVIRHTPETKVKKEGVVKVKDEFHYLD